ncbi:bifunctional Protein-tyrosine phosphatase-like/Dual specificity protein phosphatase domain/Dual specificity phosphatase [Babesia duncani]|uniref:Bifunctional Protein-tyrosine phosphatase-like/Dual specificity protein phosphatase domain/Dual specificity phosphatase n=1 Tax=Babesia duncani TaxID=323732 RepID=A0AAD9UNF3_9APIC|nr:bifunctional Protein-tyrosine phosphatase-like/Dual specificity protein phosphatase domain/Dual specificity phosphatase [Babesia duncani]
MYCPHFWLINEDKLENTGSRSYNPAYLINPIIKEFKLIDDNEMPFMETTTSTKESSIYKNEIHECMIGEEPLPMEPINKFEIYNVYNNRIFISSEMPKLISDIVVHYNITHIINVDGLAYSMNSFCKYSRIQLRTYYLREDDSNNLEDSILDAVYYIEKALEENPKNKILIYSNGHICLSPVFAIAYLIWKLGVPVFTAIHMVKAVNSDAEPNSLFTAVLIMYRRFILTTLRCNPMITMLQNET